MFSPRASPGPAKYDFHYCLHNGWLTDEVRALQNDFDGMKKKAEEFCTSGFCPSLGRLERRCFLNLNAYLLFFFPEKEGDFVIIKPSEMGVEKLCTL